eukprot:Tamp_23822.p2 GENE.Tamp_23822~~Tamp_23822.p2  ORF type:complete len:104 (+),score=17.01 Tamp_23822:671-982(+)
MFMLIEQQLGQVADLRQRIGEAQRDVDAHSNRLDQARDGIQALFSMIAQLPELAPQVAEKKGLFSSMKTAMKSTISGASTTGAAASRLLSPPMLPPPSRTGDS